MKAVHLITWWNFHVMFLHVAQDTAVCMKSVVWYDIFYLHYSCSDILAWLLAEAPGL